MNISYIYRICLDFFLPHMQKSPLTEEEFDKYYDEWLDYIEEQRGYEDMNQQDMNW